MRALWEVLEYNEMIFPPQQMNKYILDAETPTLWSRDGKSLLIGKDPDAWKD